MKNLERVFIIFIFQIISVFAFHAEVKAETYVIYGSSGDGHVATLENIVWETQFNSVSGTKTSYTYPEIEVLTRTSNSVPNHSHGKYEIYRGFLVFDTSVLPDDAIIKSASLSLNIYARHNDDNDEYAYMGVYQGFQNSTSSIAATDLMQCGDALTNPTRGSFKMDIDDISVNTHNAFSLNTAGASWIVKDGYTKLCIREGHDAENQVLDGTVYTYSGIRFHSANAADLELRPQLLIEVEETAPTQKTLTELLGDLSTYVNENLSIETRDSYMAHVKKVTEEDIAKRPIKNQLEALKKKIDQDRKEGRIAEEQYQTINTILFDIMVLAKEVPLVTQVDSKWAGDTYANGAASCGSTILQCGCVLASLSMLGQYYSIATGVDGTEVNPKNMNAWLKANNGYGAGGALIWNKALTYLGTEEGGVIKSKLSLTAFNETSAVAVDNAIKKGAPAVAFSNVSSGRHYYVLADTFGGTRLVRDPFWYNTKSHDDTYSASLKVQDYNNSFVGANLFAYSAEAKVLAGSVEIILASPAELLLTDSKGRRLGFDPETQILHKEIPGGAYVYEEPYASDVSGGNDHVIKRLIIPKTENEYFTLEVIGTGEGEYTLTTYTRDENGESEVLNVVEQTEAGKKDVFMVSVGDEEVAEVLEALHELAESVPAEYHAKYLNALRVIIDKIEKENITAKEVIVDSVVRFIETGYEGEVWVGDIIELLMQL